MKIHTKDFRVADGDVTRPAGARVHPEILKSEGIPDATHADKGVWRDR